MVNWDVHFKHGLSQTPEYKCWQQIKARCLNPSHKAYPDYGGRGVALFAGWINDFQAFLAHVGHRPSDDHSLDRYPNHDGNYEPGNVRWATTVEQNNNRRPHRRHGVRSRRPSRTDGKPTNFKHGLIHTPEYVSWSAMKSRCLNPNTDNYPRWGGRGIKIHEPWIHDFTAFLRDVGPRPSPLHSLDRWPNPNGNYEPGNVRWATKLEQTENRRPCRTGPEHGNYDHGQTGSPEYKTWASIKTRCFNPKHDRYASYGGAGITMCNRWRDSFPAFYEDLGPKPSPEHTILRTSHEGHYSCGKCPQCIDAGWPSNCRWGTKTEQNRNRRAGERSGKLDADKVRLIREKLASGVSDREVADEFGVASSLVGKIRRGEAWKPVS
jgi:hypothetical protein